MMKQDFFRSSYALAQSFWARHSPQGKAVRRVRVEAETALDRLARVDVERHYQRVLVDGTFDNANYWFRWSLLRRALGLAHAEETGLVGPYQRSNVRETFERFGISHIIDFTRVPADAPLMDREANRALAQTQCAADVLRWRLPHGVHPSIFYDHALKLQRSATLDVQHPSMPDLARQAYRTVSRAAEILDEVDPQLVIVSHPFSVTCGSLASIAASRGIDVVLPFGLFGALRFTRFFRSADLFSFYDRPSRAEMDALAPAAASAMIAVGRDYLAKRLGGKADDLASIYAFQRSQEVVQRSEICARYGWDPAKRIVAFYASNWFDWPHQLGMSNFRDFLDWTEQTFKVASATTDVNWLFKPHPAEDWFGGVALAEIMQRIGSAPHVGVSDKRWNNTSVMLSVDALITYHGTAGVEFASLGKPVLVPDRGKYEDCGFVLPARSRDEYLSLIAGPWWEKIDIAEARRRAELFAGWWFCAPEWQGNFLLGDDARQADLYPLILKLLDAERPIIDREIETLRDWWHCGHRYYHTSKMAHATSFKLTNVT